MNIRKKNNNERIWITWERQRRSIEMAKKVRAKLYIFDYKGVARYPIAILKTIAVLTTSRSKHVFVQNPSMILATLVCALKCIYTFKVIVDRHTTFRLNKPKTGSIRTWLFMKLHYYTIKNADLTIVTNMYLANLVGRAGGNPFVLPDPIPKLIPKNNVSLMGDINIALISSFGKDEPIDQVVEAMKMLNNQKIVLYITGNYKKDDNKWPEKSPKNVNFTGFLSEQNFIDLLSTIDIALVLTKSDFCMLCGCYEAISLDKPLITSNKNVLKEYFYNATFVDNTAYDISKKLLSVINNMQNKKYESLIMRREINKKWSMQYRQLENVLYKM